MISVLQSTASGLTRNSNRLLQNHIEQHLVKRMPARLVPAKAMGGTELYLAGLVRELRAHRIGSRIIAPLAPELADGYEFEAPWCVPIR
jgi:hypothetical protein